MQKTIFALSFPYSSHEKDGKDHAEKRYMQTGLLSPAASPSACRANQRRKSVRKADGRASAGIRSQKRHAAW